MTNFEDTVAEHVVERLLTEIDKGETKSIWYTNYDPNTGNSNTAQREVNIQHTIVSKVTQKITEDTVYMNRLYEKFDAMLDTDDFKDKVSDTMAQKLIAWLDEADRWSYGTADRYKNRESFKKEVRAQVIKIVAQKEADRILKADTMVTTAASPDFYTDTKGSQNAKG